MGIALVNLDGKDTIVGDKYLKNGTMVDIAGRRFEIKACSALSHPFNGWIYEVEGIEYEKCWLP